MGKKKVLIKMLSVVMAFLLIVSGTPLSVFDFSKIFSIEANAASTKILAINWTYIKKTGHQSVSGPCACYALAYCRDILDGESHKWTEYSEGYLSSEGRYSYTASWSKASYSAGVKTSTQSVLKAVYDQINNGRPAIVYVKGGRSTSQHWVAVVGYQNVTDANNLSYNNFLIIDAAGSKYELESLGGLGYSLLWSDVKGGYRYVYTNKGSVPFADDATANATYSFTFNANGGTLGNVGSFSTKYGNDFQISNTTCNRSGYTLAGWHVKRNNDNKWYVNGQGWCTESQISSNGYSKKVYSNNQTCKFDNSWISGISEDCSYTFYAVWTANTYTIAFNSNGGSGSMSTLSMTYDVAKNLTANAYIKSGYAFKGWNTKADGTGTTYADKASVKNLTSAKGSTITLYAQWTANGVPVTLNANGGSCSASSIKVTYGSTYGTIPTPTRTGYTCTGWYTASSGGSQIKSNTKVTTATNHTLYAQWRPNTLKVNYNVNGGSVNSSSGFTVTNGIVSSNDVWTYNAKKESGLYNATTFGLYRTGYTFIGWGTNASGGTIFDQDNSNLLPTQMNSAINNGDCSITLYAQWRPNILKVFYNGNGGSITSDNYSVNSDVICHKSTGTALENVWIYNSPLEFGLYDAASFGLYKTGYTFAGWGTKTSGGTIFDQKDSTLIPTQINSAINNSDCSITLYAQWRPNILKVFYNGNGGSITSDSYSINSDVICNKSTGTALENVWIYNSPLEFGLYDAASFGLYKTGYTFAGWGTKTSGGTIFDQKDSTLVPTQINSAINNSDCSITLYAQWAPIVLTSISVKTNPIDVWYCVGETLNTTGLTLTAQYSDGSTKTIDSGFTCSPTTLNTVGTQEITVTYSGETTLFDVTVSSHTAVVDEAVAATCETAGKTEGSRCSVCNKVLIAQAEVSATGHDYDFVVTPPTDAEWGYTTYTCSSCGDTYVDDFVEPLSVNITGNVITFGSVTDEVTITLTLYDDNENLYSAVVVGDNVSYSIEDVQLGSYILTVSKNNHVEKSYEIEVTEDETKFDGIIYLNGDLNGDGKVNTVDVARANASAKGVNALTGYEFACADINGDSKVNTLDVARMNAHAKGISTLW